MGRFAFSAHLSATGVTGEAGHANPNVHSPRNLWLGRGLAGSSACKIIPRLLTQAAQTGL